MVVVMARQGLLNFRSFYFSRHYLMISYFEFFSGQKRTNWSSWTSWTAWKNGKANKISHRFHSCTHSQSKLTRPTISKRKKNSRFLWQNRQTNKMSLVSFSKWSVQKKYIRLINCFLAFSVAQLTFFSALIKVWKDAAETKIYKIIYFSRRVPEDAAVNKDYLEKPDQR